MRSAKAMAYVSIPGRNQHLMVAEEITIFLGGHGICYRRWDTGAPRVQPEATPEEILTAYAPEVEALKRHGGYSAADVINVTPATPNLDAMLNKFNKEHIHSEDEVRFILKGRGLFHIHLPHGLVVAIQVEAGDMINIPAGTRHWFDVCPERTVRAIRLFKDPSGWSPQYLPDGLHEQYAPLCFGSQYFPFSNLQA